MSTSTRSRIVSLDQFRGYTVAGMFLVNFIGGYAAIHPIFNHHNTYCSYADTIMPQFFFAVGFAYRLTFLRRLERDGAKATYLHAVRRCLGLALVGLVVYGLDGRYRAWADLRELGAWGFLCTAFQDRLWQALVHIAVTSLWVLPVIGRSAKVRLAFLAASTLANVIILHGGYYDWVFAVSTNDGGPLGFLIWALPMLVGSFAYDVVAARGPRKALTPLAVWAVVLMAGGYGLSCINTVKLALADPDGAGTVWAWFVEPPFVPPTRPVDMWTMSQRAGTVSYHTFAAGFSLGVYSLFVVLCDIGSLRVGVFRTLGTNALAGYVIHDVVASRFIPFVPEDSPLWHVVLCFALFFGITYVLVLHLEKSGIYLRL